MTAADRKWELALDRPGSAEPKTLRRAGGLAAVVVAAAAVVVAYGQVQLPAYPQFVSFHAGFVFLVDAVIAFVLFGQFGYRRVPSYLVLAAAYLFNAAIMVPFLLSFPGALKSDSSIIGGPQSSIWVWHFWHILFPAAVALSLLFHGRKDHPVPARWVCRSIAASVAAVVVVVLLLTVAVTTFHDHLPVLITSESEPLTQTFYVAGGVAAAVTAAALGLALWHARRRAVLHIWLAVALTALLCDAAASLFAFGRYTVGWYFGRVESMIAAIILLLVLLGHINQLYRRLAVTLGELSTSNRTLAAVVDEKEELLAELRQRTEEIRRMAYYDAVTGLSNRRMFMERLEHGLALATRYRHSAAVLFVDLDKFKEVNDTLGHEAGDALLHKVAARLVRCVRRGDTVSRLGGDEFVIVLPEISRPDDAQSVAAKIIQLLGQPVTVAGHRLHITASVGIALSTVDGCRHAETLIARADAAMYAAKKAGRNCYRFDEKQAQGC